MNENKRKNHYSYNNGEGNGDVEIHAPYNFVPIYESVFHPYGEGDNDKSYLISQDVPFKDGKSGMIKFTFTAETPVFTKNSDNDASSSFNYIVNSEGKKQFFIPASSVKGCFRNVLEILSFGKMSQVENKSFGLRDVNNREYTKKIKDVHCGWMTIQDEVAYIEDWGEPGRISINEIATALKAPELSKLIDINYFKEITKGKNNRDKVTSPLYKYDLLKGKNLTGKFSKIKERYGKKIYQFDNKGKEGNLVLTGQSNGREEQKQYNGSLKWVGKLYEFIFFKPKATPQPIHVKDNVLKAFRTIHEDSPAYKSLWRDELKQGEKAPVFFMLDDCGEIASIGLSYMYKYPYDKDTYKAMPACMFDNQLDLAESIFGHTIKGISHLRGRVMFSHAMAISDKIVELDKREFAAYTPHSSYYPIYVKGGEDWNMATRIAGWKRYLIQSRPHYTKNNLPKDDDDPKNKIKNTAVVKFLEIGSQFEVSVRFHNLQPFELGALLSAITFHGNQDKCYHSIGFGKGYGYGKIKINDIELFTYDEGKLGPEFTKVNDFTTYLKTFESVMKEFKSDWRDSSQLKELLAIAGGWNKNVGYMSLVEYRNAKKNKHEKVLKPFSKLHSKCFRIPDNPRVNCNASISTRDSSVTKATNTNKKPQSPGRFEIGQEVTGRCFKVGTVQINGSVSTPSIVDNTKKFNLNKLLFKTLKVRITKIASNGMITQVSIISVL